MTTPSPDRDARWALVLGCSVGTGAGVARALARTAGLHVIGVHRANHPEAAAALVADVEAADRRCVLIEADAGLIDDIPGIGRQVEEILDGAQRGGLRVIVHSIANASVGYVVHPNPERQLHPKQVLKTFESMAHSFLIWGQVVHGEGLIGPGAQLLAMMNYSDECTLWGGAAIGASKCALAG